jgi:hypothetical protein
MRHDDINRVRMWNADIVELRAKNLWGMAEVLHMDANQVDKLRVLDFFNYALSLEKYYADIKKRNAENEARGML